MILGYIIMATLIISLISLRDRKLRNSCIYGGFSRTKVIAFNLFSAVTAMAWAIIAYFSVEKIL